jgi:uncharacterized damage-inducible protein DinB
MSIATLLKDYCVYNVWANARLISWLKNHPEEILTKDVPSSFPSLKLTLLHIWAAQDVWFNRLMGMSPDQFISNSFQGRTSDTMEGVMLSSEAMQDFLLGKPESFFNEAIAYNHLSTGIEYSQPAGEMILHCIQHSTYHRGQLVTIARSLGISDPPSTDYVHYLRKKVA